MIINRIRRACLKWRPAAIILLLICVSGCVSIPPALQQASWYLSGVSYMATGKGPSDHAISIAVKKDCSLFRLLKLQPVCKPITAKTNQSLISKVLEFFRKPEINDVYTNDPQVAIAAHYSN